ncbi:MAG: NADH-quinone oxidoreductase subunit C [Spirochaetaceae bacterium]|nr:MAG: NADH-quinone oxidoreductase subunit C [Spirochaetaceae bacterium]
MQNSQELRNIKIEELVAQLEEMQSRGYRLVQIGATRSTDVIECNYSFDKDYAFINYRIFVKTGESVPSASKVFWQAFLYENEIHDLFGIAFTNMAVDYRGTFYKLATRMPYQIKPDLPKGGA